QQPGQPPAPNRPTTQRPYRKQRVHDCKGVCMKVHEFPGDAMPATPRLIVIGHGMVGQRLLEELVRQHAPFHITVFCEEPYLAYDRIRLSECFDGEPDIALADEA